MGRNPGGRSAGPHEIPIPKSYVMRDLSTTLTLLRRGCVPFINNVRRCVGNSFVRSWAPHAPATFAVTPPKLRVTPATNNVAPGRRRARSRLDGAAKCSVASVGPANRRRGCSIQCLRMLLIVKIIPSQPWIVSNFGRTNPIISQFQ